MSRRLLLLCWALSAGVGSQAGTIRHDRADALYTSLATLYPSVGKGTGSGFLCSATLIDPWWILTAAHCDFLGLPGGTFTLGAEVRAVTSFIAFPTWTGSLLAGNDIALAKLASPIFSIAPAPLYSTTDELGKTGVNVGFGKTGTGLTGDTLGAGTKRAGENVIDIFGGTFPFGSFSSNIMIADFDNPSGVPEPGGIGSPAPLNLEYNIAPGDSGGGLFIGSAVAGVHSFYASVDGLTNADYGDYSGSTRVSVYLSWIHGIIQPAQQPGPIPEPGTLALLGVGLIVIRRRRR